MINISNMPKIAVVRIDSWIPKWHRAQTTAKMASAKIHHGTSVPVASWIVLEIR